MPKRILQGTVVSDAANKSVVVLVERKIKHPVFGKFIRKSKRFMAHDENNVAKKGDVVRIQECRPISKQKCWTLVTDQAADSAASA